jgi:tetratricopeptide (TPR) repeat protein
LKVLSLKTKRAQGESTISGENKQDSRIHLAREPVILVLLLLLAVAFFVLVTGVSHIYDAQRGALASRWYARGVAEFNQQHYPKAVNDFRAALLYATDNRSYQFKLAEALAGEGRVDEARAYLLNLWAHEPENGRVNLELARIAVRKGNRAEALRYFHNAIYATWSENTAGEQSQQSQTSNSEVERQNARFELINYLLGTQANAQAQSELIALSANLGNDPAQHLRVGELFLRADDYEHALAEFRQALDYAPVAAMARAGAGRAAYELGRYSQAQRYLQGAVTRNPKDEQSAALLKTTTLVLQMDPFGRKIAVAERNRIVIRDFAVAGNRLKSCPGQTPSPTAATASKTSAPAPAAGQASLASQWQKMKPQITERGLQRNPELVDQAMDLVFEIEKSSVSCGTPAAPDKALLLIAKLHEGK